MHRHVEYCSISTSLLPDINHNHITALVLHVRYRSYWYSCSRPRRRRMFVVGNTNIPSRARKVWLLGQTQSTSLRLRGAETRQAHDATVGRAGPAHVKTSTRFLHLIQTAPHSSSSLQSLPFAAPTHRVPPPYARCPLRTSSSCPWPPATNAQQVTPPPLLPPYPFPPCETERINPNVSALCARKGEREREEEDGRVRRLLGC